jgi:hypothetical protein
VADWCILYFSALGGALVFASHHAVYPPADRNVLPHPFAKLAVLLNALEGRLGFSVFFCTRWYVFLQILELEQVEDHILIYTEYYGKANLCRIISLLSAEIQPMLRNLGVTVTVPQL